MEEKVKKHWRYGGKITHIGVEVLPNGENVDIEIAKVEYKEKVKINGQDQGAWICTFKANPYFKLPMVLNTTNRRLLCRLANTSYPEDVKDFKITLTREMSSIPGMGAGYKDWALRISPNLPKAASYEDQINSLIQEMDNCTSLAALQSFWQSLKHKNDPKLVLHKDKLKNLLG